LLAGLEFVVVVVVVVVLSTFFGTDGGLPLSFAVGDFVVSAEEDLGDESVVVFVVFVVVVVVCFGCLLFFLSLFTLLFS
jgi:hypothetical protein